MKNMWEDVCKERFSKLEDTVSAISRKVFNGFSKSIDDLNDTVKYLRGLVVWLIVVGGLGVIGILVQFLVFIGGTK
jgi:hypothetical protein